MPSVKKMFMIKDSLRKDREGLALLIGDVSLQRYMTVCLSQDEEIVRVSDDFGGLFSNQGLELITYLVALYLVPPSL